MSECSVSVRHVARKAFSFVGRKARISYAADRTDIR